MIILFILILLALFSFVSVIKMIIQIRSFNQQKEEDEVTLTKNGSGRKISSSVGKYVDFDEIKK